MNVLLAHHLEPHHVPILLGLFASGFFLGWQALSRWLSRGRSPIIDPSERSAAAPRDGIVSGEK